jgi:hypothetical protein
MTAFQAFYPAALEGRYIPAMGVAHRIATQASGSRNGLRPSRRYFALAGLY